ncbi:MAG: hypothetical protein R2712_27475 [Vicinamibacterales bacterium]
MWAPNARRVSVVGDFNGWDGRVHPMRARTSGFWEIFIPDLGTGDAYKCEIVSPDGQLLLKSDPVARYFETPPRTASVVWTDDYEWADGDWMRRREQEHGWLERPMSIYEVHLGSWRRAPDGRLLSSARWPSSSCPT